MSFWSIEFCGGAAGFALLAALPDVSLGARVALLGVAAAFILAAVLADASIKWSDAWLRARGNRFVAVLGALVLVLVPTIFTVFPGWTEWGTWQRSGVIAGWVIAAAVIAVTSYQRDVKLQAEAEQTNRLVRWAALEATTRLAGIPALYDLTVYLYDADLGLLLPFFPETVTDPNDYRVFPPGAGATGTAFEEDATVVVTGDAVSNADYGLTPDQQRRFAEYTVVAATPMRKLRRGTVIGCLTVIGVLDDGSFAKDGEVTPQVKILEDLADTISNFFN